MLNVRFFLIIIFHLLGATLFAQNSVSGIVNEASGKGLPGATVKLMRNGSLVLGAMTDEAGKYSFARVEPGEYLIQVVYLGYKDGYTKITMGRDALKVPAISMKESAKELSEVEVKTIQQRGEQKGDTTAFNADAFKTHPDATAEDLVKKMPGVTSDNNGVKVNGENVQKVFVDGKPFFGEDPNAALKNLPAEIIDKVEIFDRMSDQSAFTGFDDGNQQKSINLVTRKNKNQGVFGKVYGGFGSDEESEARYNAGATINKFKSKQRITLLMMSNSINQQNFSISDVTGAMGGGGSSGRGGSGRGMGGGSYYGGSSNMMSASQNGITATQAAGINYSDEWSKKLTVSGSYFFNYTDNTTQSEIVRNYLTNDKMFYEQSNKDGTTNLNHKFNARFEYAMDSLNKFIYTPSLSYQDNRLKSRLGAGTYVNGNNLLNETSTKQNTGNDGYNMTHSLLYMRKLNKPGRTISMDLTGTVNEKNNNGKYYSKTLYPDTSEILDQDYDNYSNNRKISMNAGYTEPLSKFSQLQINYNPSLSDAVSNKYTNDYNEATDQYEDFNSTLSSIYRYTYNTQKGGLSYKYNKDKWNVSIGADGQQASLNGKQEYPVMFVVSQSFVNVLPNARIQYKVSSSKNLRINYRSSTNIPSVTQLQDVLDVSNPLQVKTGNPALKQTFENSINIRYGGFDTKTSRNAMVFSNFSTTQNYISSVSTILRKDSIIQGYELKAGSQLSRPVNLQGYYSGRLFFVYGFPVTKIKSNLNFNGGLTLNHTPGIINEALNVSDNYAASGGIYAGSNISKNLDFSVSYNANYNIVKNSVQIASDNNYFNQTATGKLNWIIKNRWIINTDITHTMYNGLTQDFNQQFLLWSGFVGVKFGAKKNLEAKLSVFDILNQNRSISRTVTGNYIEDNFTTTLQRYFMFTLTWNIRKFTGQMPKQEENAFPFPGMGPGGMRPHRD